jgi:ABC-type uncharacterized transport system permease subunit
MNKYFSFFIRGYKKFYEYPQRIFFTFILSVMLVFLLSTIWFYFIGGEFIEYIKYFLIVELFLSPFFISSSVNSEYSILANTGYNITITKPVYSLFVFITHSLGQNFVSIIFNGIVVIIVLYLIGFSASILTILLFLILLIFVILYHSLMGYIIGGIGFFTYKTWGFFILKGGIEAFAGGAAAPLYIFPKSAIKLLSFLPFAYAIYYPTQFLLTGDITIFITALTGLIIWNSIFFIVGYLIHKKGMKKFESQGG